MRMYIKVAAIGLVSVLLAGCGDKNEPSAAAVNSGAQTAVASDQRVNLLEGRFSFIVPKNLKDKGGQLSGQTNNMQIFADDTGRQNLVTLVTESDEANPEVLIEAMANQYYARDSNAKVIAKEPVSFGEQPAWRLDIVSYTKGQAIYNSILMTIVGDELVTIQIALPENGAEKPSVVIQNVIDSIVVKLS